MNPIVGDENISSLNIDIRQIERETLSNTGTGLEWLILLLRILGIPITSTDSMYWKAYNVVATASTVFLLIFLIVQSLRHMDSLDFLTISLIIFNFSAVASYINISLCPYRGVNFIHLLSCMATNENISSIRSVPVEREASINKTKLRIMVRNWITVIILGCIFNYSLIFFAHGSGGEVEPLHVGHKNAWSASSVVYVYVNFAWLLPVLLVRIPCSFFEKKLIRLIEYVETRENYPIDIRDWLSWYDDVYEVNERLNSALSPIVTQNILFLFPLIVFLLQGFLIQEISAANAIALLAWIGSNGAVLFVITASVAQLDALNLRLEIALGGVQSCYQFENSDTVCQYRLALSKLRALPFGVTFYGLKKRVSFREMWTISSLFVSVFIFMLGYTL